MNTHEKIRLLQEKIDALGPGELVFFGGAGVSTESGIPDFRSARGIFTDGDFAISPEQIVSHSFFEAHPAEFFAFYFDRMVAQNAKPNACHKKLAELEERGILHAVITQNIDGLHQMAGSKRVVELHGTVHKNHCVSCGRAYNLQEVLALHEGAGDGVPRCEACGNIVKPDVVLYEEALSEEAIQNTVHALDEAKMLVVAGTSLVVYPAASFLNAFGGDTLAIVNLSPTSADERADLCISAKVGDVFSW